MGDIMIQFKNSNQMKAFMKKEAVRLNMDIRNIYTTFVARCILERLSKSAADKILIKGSSAEIAYLGRCVRAITDIDIAITTILEDRINLITSILIDRHSDIWNKTKLKYDFMDDEIDLDGEVYYKRAVIRDLLQRNGMDMHDNIAHQNKRKVYKI